MSVLGGGGGIIGETATSIIFDKHASFVAKCFVATSICLSRQKFCLDKLTFVATNTFLSRQNTSFVARKVCLLRQNFCYNKHICRDKNI